MTNSSVNSADSPTTEEIDADIRAELDARHRAPLRTLGWVLLIGSILGWVSSFALTMDKFALLEDSNASLACDINPFISCGTFLQTWQASTFGFPNMIIGFTGFAIMGAVGSLFIGRVVLPRWFMWCVFGGVLFAFAFVHWLALNALFAIHALCPWCLVVWASVAPMFFATLAHLVETEVIGARGGVRRLLRSWIPLTLMWYVIVIVAIFFNFLPQWMAMFG